MKIWHAIPAAALVALGGWALAQSPADPLEQGFRHPPNSARPRTWWHWTAGNVTKDGITKDLDWMKRVGIAGSQLADVAAGSGQTVDFGMPERYDAVRHAAAEADRLGLEMTIFSSPGWSETGGPWVKPEEAMKKLVWSETTIEGPRSFTGKLPHPPSNNIPFVTTEAVAAAPIPTRPTTVTPPCSPTRLHATKRVCTSMSRGSRPVPDPSTPRPCSTTTSPPPSLFRRPKTVNPHGCSSSSRGPIPSAPYFAS
jgi:hypothetical protein